LLRRAASDGQNDQVAERVKVREIEDDEGRRLLRIIRRGIGSVATWRRAQMVLLSAQGMPVAKIAEVTFTSPDRVRDVLHNFNADGFDSLYPKYKGGRPRTFTLPERREIKKSGVLGSGWLHGPWGSDECGVGSAGVVLTSWWCAWGSVERSPEGDQRGSLQGADGCAVAGSAGAIRAVGNGL
jgi:hypothetical protein